MNFKYPYKLPKQLDKRLFFTYSEKTYQFDISKHLWHTRKGDRFRRNHMMKGYWQYVDLLKYLLIHHDISSHVGERIVYIFNSSFGKLAILISIEKVHNSSTICFALITIDYMRDRNFNEHEMFMKEKKIYTHYTLPISYLADAYDIEKGFESDEYGVLHTKLFIHTLEKFLQEYYYKKLNRRYLYTTLYKLVEKEIIPQGSIWIQFNVEEEKNIYMNISIERLRPKKLYFIIRSFYYEGELIQKIIKDDELKIYPIKPTGLVKFEDKNLFKYSEKEKLFKYKKYKIIKKKVHENKIEMDKKITNKASENV